MAFKIKSIGSMSAMRVRFIQGWNEDLGGGKSRHYKPDTEYMLDAETARKAIEVGRAEKIQSDAGDELKPDDNTDDS